MNPEANAPLAVATGSVEYRDLRDGDRILEVDEFWVEDLGQFIPIHNCASVSARWMVGSPYSSNFYVRARRPMTPSPNAAVSDGGTPFAPRPGSPSQP